MSTTLNISFAKSFLSMITATWTASLLIAFNYMHRVKTLDFITAFTTLLWKIGEEDSCGKKRELPMLDRIIENICHLEVI